MIGNETQNRWTIIRTNYFVPSITGQKFAVKDEQKYIHRVNGPCIFLPINVTSGHASFSLSLSLSLIHTLIHPIYVPWSVERRHIRLAVSLVSVLGTSNKRRESIGRTMAGNDAARPPRGMQAAWKRRSLINFTLSIKPFNISLHAIFIFIYILYIYIWTFFCFFILATSNGIVKHLCTSAKRILSLLVVSGNLNVSQRLKEFLLPRSLHRSASLLSDESNQGLIYVLRLSLRVFSIVCHRTRSIVLCLAKARSCPQKFSRKIHA